MKRKCAVCPGAHEAWSRQCPTRKEELEKTKAAYDNRPYYHPIPEDPAPAKQTGLTSGPPRRIRSTRDIIQTLEERSTKGSTQTGRGRKRTNTGAQTESTDKDNGAAGRPSSQRPRKTIHPSRRALESQEDTVIIRSNSEHMDVDESTDS
jgi:hypothetical protein